MKFVNATNLLYITFSCSAFAGRYMVRNAEQRLMNHVLKRLSVWVNSDCAIACHADPLCK